MSVRSIPAADLADICSELAGFFGAPLEAEDVRALRRHGGFGPLGALAADPLYAADLRRAREAVLAPASEEETVSRLNSGYCQLFLGIGGAAGAPPFESAYRGTGRLYQEAVDSMAELLATCGLRPADGFAEPPDHLAIELSLLAQFIQSGADAPDLGDGPAAALRRRLAEWVPAFARGCARYDRSGFYAPLAAVLTTLLEDGTLALAA
ncbi:molecular chaperone TorD family protein [Azospirillum sp. TSO35-2]|uniref:TorD/DmsD family molecular chaperone n=1 Tax=Azospirillum sp. TSO35-2 TaxID=716796 RepID=UPI000D643468|nr:molecular chaperone TorD family protein [Azospirillum sp. TSO35-2]